MFREFKSLPEVELLVGYHPDNLVVVDQYQAVEGPYHFDHEVRCRLRKENGNPCAEGHKHGWVVRSKDGSKALIGGDCAKTNFGVNSDMVQDTNRATTALDRAKVLAKLQGQLADRDVKIDEVTQVLKELVDLRARIGEISSALGKLAWRALEDMARTGNAQVRVTGVRPATYDNNDERTSERLAIQIPIGSIRAVSIARPSAMTSVAEALRSIATAYRKADLDILSSSSRSKEGKELSAALSRHGRAIADAKELLTLGLAFERNDFSVLCFAIRDRAERYRLARNAMRLSGRTITSDAAKDWVIRQDAKLKETHGIGRIEFD